MHIKENNYRPYLQYGFSNALMITSVGGLVLCGMNEGLGDTASSDQHACWLPWTPYFSHMDNTCVYQTTLMGWFSRWGYSMNADQPGDIDRAIMQTNLFIDASRTFAEIGRTDDAWIVAIEAFALAVRALDASGVLVISKTLGDNIAWYVNHKKFSLPEWGTTFGSGLTWTEPQYDRLKWREAVQSKIPISCVGHPCSQISHDSVSKSANSMKPWIEGVLGRYCSIQRTSVKRTKV